jgi:hypothetical protein
MNKPAIAEVISRSLPDADNKVVNSISNILQQMHLKDVREEVKKAKESYVPPKGAVSPAGEGKGVQYWLDNPLPPEDEERYLRAIFHKDLDVGQINPQLVDKLDKIIGVKTVDQIRPIGIVGFGEIFPNMAEAIRVCSENSPTVPQEGS